MAPTNAGVQALRAPEGCSTLPDVRCGEAGTRGRRAHPYTGWAPNRRAARDTAREPVAQEGSMDLVGEGCNGVRGGG